MGTDGEAISAELIRENPCNPWFNLFRKSFSTGSYGTAGAKPAEPEAPSMPAGAYKPF